MMAENKNIPEIRFAGFTDPWEQRKLGDIATFINGRAYSQPELLTDGKYKVLRVGNFYTNDSWYYSDLELGEKYYANYGDLLYTWSATFGPHIWLGDKVIYHYHIWKIDLSDQLEKHFAVQLLEQDKDNILSSKNGSTMVHITKEGMEQKEVIVPSDTAEQEAIGAFFGKLDELITLHQRKYDRLKNVKKSMLEKMFPRDGANVPEIRFAGFTDAWEQRKLADIGEVVTGSTPSTQHPEYYSEDGIPWVTPTDITENVISDTPRKLSSLGARVGRVVPAETILVTCIASIEKNTMLANTGSFNQQINGLVPNKKEYDPYFLLTESYHWSAKMKREAAAGTMQIVNKNEFSAIETTVPKLPEQKAIGDYFKKLDNLITLHQRKYEKLKQIKKSMLEKMFV